MAGLCANEGINLPMYRLGDAPCLGSGMPLSRAFLLQAALPKLLLRSPPHLSIRLR